MEDLKTQRVTLGRKGRDHIYGAPSEVAQCRVLWAWIWTSQALYQQATTVIDRNITGNSNTNGARNGDLGDCDPRIVFAPIGAT